MILRCSIDKARKVSLLLKRPRSWWRWQLRVQHSLTNGSVATAALRARAVMQGFIAALKDGFGFIETADHSKEVFFHFSNLEGNPDGLELGTEVEYSLGRVSGSGGGCASAEFVRVLPRGTVPLAKPLDATLNGTVTRTLRALNPDQAKYCGLIQMEGGTSYEFGIMGLACKREILQVGDPVTFQADAEGRATNIVPVRKKRRATVDAIKGGFGFLSLAMETEENRRLFFHMSEVRGNPAELQPGDTVEFVMLTNPRNGKSSACNVVKVGNKSAVRPAASVRSGCWRGCAPRRWRRRVRRASWWCAARAAPTAAAASGHAAPLAELLAE
ncbi:RNA-binding protein Unr-like [Choristoneura fumiferana]|uniref:RNA-binding protein Unr-like n=1 Tax=Choristoneura fumiferana TaxID=7141 RepID=UPI003D158BB0